MVIVRLVLCIAALWHGWNMFARIQLWHQSLVISAQALVGSRSFICTDPWLSAVEESRWSTGAPKQPEQGGCNHHNSRNFWDTGETFLPTQLQVLHPDLHIHVETKLICLLHLSFLLSPNNYPYDMVPSLASFSSPEFPTGFAPFRNLPV